MSTSPSSGGAAKMAPTPESAWNSAVAQVVSAPFDAHWLAAPAEPPFREAHVAF
jgi:hypothetical protein